MRTIFLFILCFVCYSYQIDHHQEHLRKIHDTIYDYSNVYKVDTICNTIERRLRNSGIYPNTTGFCVNATISSTFADTLADLYSLFKWSDNDFISERQRELISQRQECNQPCDQKNYLGKTNIQEFLHSIIPDIKWDPCFTNPDYINMTSLAYINRHNAVIQSGGIRKSAWSGSFTCHPLKPIEFGQITTTFDKYNATCFDCIDTYLENKLEFEKNQHFFGPTMKTRLRLEIARVWRKQMPSLIAQHTFMMGFDI